MLARLTIRDELRIEKTIELLQVYHGCVKRRHVRSNCPQEHEDWARDVPNREIWFLQGARFIHTSRLYGRVLLRVCVCMRCEMSTCDLLK